MKHLDLSRIASLSYALRHTAVAPYLGVKPAVPSAGRQLLVDVSTIIRTDSRTGIQRVVRALLGEMSRAAAADLIVQPVFASRNHRFCKAVFTPDGELTNEFGGQRQFQAVAVNKGDVFIGLDLAAQTLPLVEAQLAEWRSAGVSINIMVYDLLPLVRPEWFSERLVRNFRRWLGVVARQSDRCVCISRAVAQGLEGELAARASQHRPDIVTIPLGADLQSSFPSMGLSADLRRALEWVERAKPIMTVGTIEPRKGHDRLLDAFDHLWRNRPDSDLALLIVGRPGWKTEQLQDRIRHHPEHGKRLVWLDQASDECLAELYSRCGGIVSASQQEGFGLPLIEGAAHGAPVLARDIPVFREIGGSLFDYFESDAPAALAGRIVEWVAKRRPPSSAEIAQLPRWSDSAAALLANLGLIETISLEPA